MAAPGSRRKREVATLRSKRPRSSYGRHSVPGGEPFPGRPGFRAGSGRDHELSRGTRDSLSDSTERVNRPGWGRDARGLKSLHRRALGPALGRSPPRFSSPLRREPFRRAVSGHSRVAPVRMSAREWTRARGARTSFTPSPNGLSAPGGRAANAGQDAKGKARVEAAPSSRSIRPGTVERARFEEHPRSERERGFANRETA